MPNTEKKYIILVHQRSSHLEDEVNKKIADGWMPIGGPVSHLNGCCQAMVRGLRQEDE